MLIAVAVVPVAVWGLAKATPFIASLVMLIAVVGWIAAVVTCLEGEGELRAAARGFAVASLLFAVVVFRFDNSKEFLNQSLLTTRLLSWAQLSLAEEDSGKRFVVPDPVSFFFVGHIYCCVIIGLLGSWLAGLLYHLRQRANSLRRNE